MTNGNGMTSRSTDEEPFGFKVLTAENIVKFDPVLGWIGVSVDPGPEQDEFRRSLVQTVQSMQLAETVPVALRRHFFVARGTICYGLCFYPLFDVGFEQLLRIAERAVAVKCSEAGAPPKVKRFVDQIKFLTEQGIITSPRWDAIRMLRNMSSHHKDQTIHAPKVIDRFRLIVDEINALFETSAQASTVP